MTKRLVFSAESEKVEKLNKFLHFRQLRFAIDEGP